MMRAPSSVMDIQPEDIENSETVPIIWNLANEQFFFKNHEVLICYLMRFVLR